MIKLIIIKHIFRQWRKTTSMAQLVTILKHNDYFENVNAENHKVVSAW